jgi:hypothetical protein
VVDSTDEDAMNGVHAIRQPAQATAQIGVILEHRAGALDELTEAFFGQALRQLRLGRQR